MPILANVCRQFSASISGMRCEILFIGRALDSARGLPYLFSRGTPLFRMACAPSGNRGRVSGGILTPTNISNSSRKESAWRKSLSKMMDCGSTKTMLPSLSSMTTRPPLRVSTRSPGFRKKPAESANVPAELPVKTTAVPVTLAARASTGPLCATSGQETAREMANAERAVMVRAAVGRPTGLTGCQAALPQSHCPFPHRPHPQGRALPGTGSGR